MAASAAAENSWVVGGKTASSETVPSSATVSRSLPPASATTRPESVTSTAYGLESTSPPTSPSGSLAVSKAAISANCARASVGGGLQQPTGVGELRRHLRADGRVVAEVHGDDERAIAGHGHVGYAADLRPGIRPRSGPGRHARRCRPRCGPRSRWARSTSGPRRHPSRSHQRRRPRRPRGCRQRRPRSRAARSDPLQALRWWAPARRLARRPGPWLRSPASAIPFRVRMLHSSDGSPSPRSHELPPDACERHPTCVP